MAMAAEKGGLKPAAPIGPSYGDPNTFGAAVRTQGGDYDRIMGEYDKLLKSGSSNPLQFSPISPTLTKYSTSGDQASSMANLSGLASSGGYSPEDIQNIRARSISPIRSIYSSAQQGLNRQRGLQGGYSPNFNAASTKMAREMSEQIGQRVTDVEGGIAQNRAANRLSIAPTFSSAAANENAARMGTESRNTDIVNQTDQFNARMGLDAQRQNQQDLFQNVEGMRSLYGTTPALVNTFGEQVSDAQRLGQNQQQTNDARAKAAADAAARMAEAAAGAGKNPQPPKPK